MSRARHAIRAEVAALMILVLWIGSAVTLSVFSVLRYDTWRATGFDMGWYEQSLWLIGHGKLWTMSTLASTIPVKQAAALILYPLGYIYDMSGPRGILVLQAFVLTSGVVPLYAYARERRLSPFLRGTIPVLYLVSPPIIGLTLFDFHPDAMAVAAFTWALWAIAVRRWTLYALCLAVGVLSKNSTAAVAVLLTWPLLVKRQWLWAALTFVVSFSVLMFDFFWLGEHLSHGIYGWENYSYLGKSPFAALGTLGAALSHFIQRHLLWVLPLSLAIGGIWAARYWLGKLRVPLLRLPRRVRAFAAGAAAMLTAGAIATAAETLAVPRHFSLWARHDLHAVPGFLPLQNFLAQLVQNPSYWYIGALLIGAGVVLPAAGLRTGHLIPALGVIALNIIATGHRAHLDPFNQYSGPAIPFLFFSLIDAFPAEVNRLWHTSWAAASLFASLSLFILHIPVIWPEPRPPVAALESALKRIPPGAPAVGDNATLPLLANRLQAYWVGPFVVPGTYELLNLWNSPGGRPLLITALANPQVRVLYHRQWVWLLVVSGHPPSPP